MVEAMMEQAVVDALEQVAEELQARAENLWPDVQRTKAEADKASARWSAAYDAHRIAVSAVERARTRLGEKCAAANLKADDDDPFGDE